MILNVERFSKTLSGNHSVMLEIWRLSAPINEALIGDLTSALAQRAWNEARENAHMLKGALANIGADELGAACGAIYDALGQADYASAIRSANTLGPGRDRLARAVDAFEQSMAAGARYFGIAV